MQATVIDDSAAFAYPAEFAIDHDILTSIVSFTATYNGQAIKGERVEVSGIIEQAADGSQRIVVGSSREAHGEYIKVIRWFYYCQGEQARAAIATPPHTILNAF